MYQHLLLPNSVPFSLAAAVFIGCGAWRLRGTTLVPPALWALSSVVAVGGVEVLAAMGLVNAGPMSPLRYAAAATVLCSMMAVLGAKRPQDRAWQWVVVALLATLWLPAANAWLVGPDEPVHLTLAWRVFVAVLTLLGPLNYLPTGNWLPVLLAAAGQGVLLAPFVAPAGWSLGEKTVPVAMAAFLAATGIAWIRTGRYARRDARDGSEHLDDLNATWLRFRDAFGAFWAVRVMQRVNQGVESMEPPFVLAWDGWRCSGAAVAEQPPGQDAASSMARVQKSMNAMLRRFVRPDA